MDSNAGRPSSVKRRENLRRLIDEMKTRDMDTEAVMDLLGCVRSTARTYLNELLAKEIISLCIADTGKWTPAPTYRASDVSAETLQAVVAHRPTAAKYDLPQDPLMAAFFGTPK